MVYKENVTMRITKQLKTPLLLTVVMVVICGVLYPSAVTLFAQTIFPNQANGSLIEEDGEVIGSRLIGQNFKEDSHFTSRPSSVQYNAYDVTGEEIPVVSSGTFNYAPSNPLLVERMEADTTLFLEKNPTVEKSQIPSELLSASGSGLDPHISLKSAEVQIDRVLQATNLSEKQLQEIIKKATESQFGGVFAEPVVNVLRANQLIDEAVS